MKRHDWHETVRRDTMRIFGLAPPPTRAERARRRARLAWMNTRTAIAYRIAPWLQEDV